MRFTMHPYSEMLLRDDSATKRDDTTRYHADMQEIEGATSTARYEARRTHREFASWHEGYAVLREEVEELWESIKLNAPRLDELLQIAAVAQLMIAELGNTGGERELADSQRIADLEERIEDTLLDAEGRPW